jgi:hypothetical protein
MHGGDFRQAGKRQGQELTTSFLRQLLEDDVRGLCRRKDSRAESAESKANEGPAASESADISDAELDSLVDKEKLFEVDPETGEYTFPSEGEMFDIVSVSGSSSGLLSLQAIE